MGKKKEQFIAWDDCGEFINELFGSVDEFISYVKEELGLEDDEIADYVLYPVTKSFRVIPKTITTTQLKEIK